MHVKFLVYDIKIEKIILKHISEFAWWICIEKNIFYFHNGRIYKNRGKLNQIIKDNLPFKVSYVFVEIKN